LCWSWCISNTNEGVDRIANPVTGGIKHVSVRIKCEPRLVYVIISSVLTFTHFAIAIRGLDRTLRIVPFMEARSSFLKSLRRL
jgi:hypothetical protein